MSATSILTSHLRGEPRTYFQLTRSTHTFNSHVQLTRSTYTFNVHVQRTQGESCGSSSPNFEPQGRRKISPMWNLGKVLRTTAMASKSEVKSRKPGWISSGWPPVSISHLNRIPRYFLGEGRTISSLRPVINMVPERRFQIWPERVP